MNPKKAKNTSIRLRALGDDVTKDDVMRAFMGSPVDRSNEQILCEVVDVLESNDKRTNGVLILHTIRQEREDVLDISDRTQFMDTLARIVCRSFCDVTPTEFRDGLVSMLEGVRYTEGSPD